MLAGFFLLAASSAIGSGLADERSDAAGGKRTIVLWLGNTRSKRLAGALVALAALVWVAAGCLADGLPLRLALWVAAAWLLARLVALTRLSRTALTDAFPELRRWKAALNGAVGASGVVVALTFLGESALSGGWPS